MKKIFCVLNLFDQNQKVFIIDNCVQQHATNVDVENLSEKISALSNVTDINHIVLTGPKIFCSKVAKEILTYSKINYNRNEIEVEII